jgi:hypothetical protein
MMRFYRALLHMYPVSFRREYGDELTGLFELRLRQAGAGLPRLLLSLAAIFEVAGSAAAVHWDVLRHDLRYTFRTLARSPGFARTSS